MSIVLGLDLGTTTITALALDARSGDLLGRVTVPNHAETTSADDRVRGRSEWDARTIADAACRCLREIATKLGAGWARLAGLCVTGQQHSTVLVKDREPLTPLINWQDRRGLETYPGTERTWVQEAQKRLGDDAVQKTGCRLSASLSAVMLLWLKENGRLPAGGKACALADYFTALLTGGEPVTDSTFAAGTGLFNVRANSWAADLFGALSFSPDLFPEVQASGAPLGTITGPMAEATGLPEGLPVIVGLGDNQASFLGSVANRADSVLVNVGTGGQVSVFSQQFLYDPIFEVRPFPGGGFLLACVGLCGGRTYAVLERFFRQVGEQLLGLRSNETVFDTMNLLAASIPADAGGLRCDPYFTGTRHRPELRASWTGVSPENFTPAHLTRALLEGMARAFREGYDVIAGLTASRKSVLIGAGNGIRENPVLAQIIANEFGLPLRCPRHREEAAFGAALIAALGAGLIPDLDGTGGLVRYAHDSETGRT
jgi:sugar (pentulose or hexulose) kinase